MTGSHGQDHMGDEMDREVSRDEVYAALGALAKSQEAGFAQIVARLDKLNGKTEVNSIDIAVLKAIRLEEKEAREDDPPMSRKKEATFTGAIAASVVGLIEVAKMVWGKP